MLIALERRAAFGPFIAGPEGCELFEVMMGAPRSWPDDPDGFEKLRKERGVERLPNLPIDLRDRLEDACSP